VAKRRTTEARRAAGRRLNPRRLAIDALVRIDDGAYANLLVPALLADSDLDERDRHFVTNLVYGTTRMRRALDWQSEPFITRPLDPPVRAAIRLGVYQLHYLHTPPHAAVSATVDAAPVRASGLVNAVLRRVSAAPPRPWPDLATELSYPDWIVERLAAELGATDATDALRAMNEPAEVTERPDGYVQDRASQAVTEFVGARPGERVLDLCAAPGGKATALAGVGATVVAADVRPSRAALIAANAVRVGAVLLTVVADGRRPPWPTSTFDRVLVDAPCSGLGVLRRRPDARWRVEPDDVAALAVLQRDLLTAAMPLVRPGGTLVYSVCTLTTAETTEVATWLDPNAPTMVILPQTEGTDGMFALRVVTRAHR
jgi:16S rRNA (cytosine967-C5)-methyltransferase